MRSVLVSLLKEKAWAGSSGTITAAALQNVPVSYNITTLDFYKISPTR